MRVSSITVFGGLLLAACAQGETLDGFGGSDFSSGSGGTAGTTTGKATGSTANASTNAVVSSSATSTKAASVSNSASATVATTNTTNTVATTAAPATTTAVTTGGPMQCFDVCTAGAAPDPLACFGDANALACIAGICIADPDCCDVAWDDECALAGTFAAIAGACSC